MAATHVDVDEALAEAPRLVHLAVRLAAVSNALAAEARRLRPYESMFERAREVYEAEGDHVRPSDRQVARYILGLDDR